MTDYHRNCGLPERSIATQNGQAFKKYPLLNLHKSAGAYFYTQCNQKFEIYSEKVSLIFTDSHRT